jgi:hypothetical protein
VCEVTNKKSSPAWIETAKSGAEYTVRTRCPQCGRKHITVFRLRHVSDSFFVQLGHFFRYAKHFDFRRLRRCTNSGQHPNWRPS